MIVGLNWYLAEDESHNADGKHISYLDAGSRLHAMFRPTVAVRPVRSPAAAPPSFTNRVALPRQSPRGESRLRRRRLVPWSQHIRDGRTGVPGLRVLR